MGVIHHGMEMDGIWYPVPYIETDPMSSRLLLLSLLNIPSLSGYACHIHAASSRYGALDLN